MQPKFRRAPKRKPVSDGSAIWLRPLVWLIIALVAYFGVVTWLLPVLVRLSSGTNNKVTQNFHTPWEATGTGHSLRSDGSSGAAPVSAPSANVAPPAAAGGSGESWCEDPGEPPRPPVVEPREYFFAVDSSKVKVLDHFGGNLFSWWTGITPKTSWEEDTLFLMKGLLIRDEKRKVVIDFGSWLGPTVLFAAPYAKKVYSMEPDIGAYEELYWNIKWNPDRAAKISLSKTCISNQTSTLTMHGHPGDSSSSLFGPDPKLVEEEKKNPNKKKGVFREWTVQCMTLDRYIEDHKINLDEIAYIKMDTEGAEAIFMHQLAPWIIKHKPTLLLALHATHFPHDRAAQKVIKDMMLTYKTVSFYQLKGEIDMKAFDVGGWCNYCSILLTDIPFDTVKSEVMALKAGKVERWQTVWDAFVASEVKAGRGTPQWS